MLNKLLVVAGVIILLTAIVTPSFVNATPLTTLWCRSVLHGAAIPGPTVPFCDLLGLGEIAKIAPTFNTAICPTGYVQTSAAQCTLISSALNPTTCPNPGTIIYQPVPHISTPLQLTIAPDSTFLLDAGASLGSVVNNFACQQITGTVIAWNFKQTSGLATTITQSGPVATVIAPQRSTTLTYSVTVTDTNGLTSAPVQSFSIFVS